METPSLNESAARSGPRRPLMAQKRRLHQPHHTTMCSNSSDQQLTLQLPTRRQDAGTSGCCSAARSGSKYSNYIKRSAISGALCLLALLCLSQEGPSPGRNSWTGVSRALQSLGGSSIRTKAKPMVITTPPRSDPHAVKYFAPYTTADIARTQSLFVTKAMPLGQGRPALLIFDGQNFHTHTPPGDGGSNSYIGRLNHASSLLEHALTTHFSARFRPGQPPFQLLMSATDLPHTDCLRHPQAPGELPLVGADGEEGCGTAAFPPILQFGSIPKLEGLLPNTIAMPLPTYLPCLTEWRREKLAETEGGAAAAAEAAAPSASDPNTCRHRLAHLPHHTTTDEPYAQSLSWEQLHPTIVWRGSDHHFLPEFDLRLLRGSEMFALGVLPDDLADAKTLVQMLLDRWDMLIPRWRAVALSLGVELGARLGYREVAKMEGLGRQESLRCDDGCRMVRSLASDEDTGDDENEKEEATEATPWIDAKFFEGSDERFRKFTDLGLDVVTNEWMGKDELARYRYHIDLGGGGGTTWEGTLTKLALPGLLFHHETVTKDDYHDRMVPWKHYVPVKMDLSDLKEKFDWAEAFPEAAQKIARAGTELAQHLASEEYMADVWDLNFRRRLDEVVKAYLPGEGETMESILESYRADGLEFVKREF